MASKPDVTFSVKKAKKSDDIRPLLSSVFSSSSLSDSDKVALAQIILGVVEA